MSTQVVTDSLVYRWESDDWTSGAIWTDRIGHKNIKFSSSPSSKTSDGIELTKTITFTSEQLSSITYPATIEWIGRIDGNWNTISPGNVFGWNSSNGTWANGILCYSKPWPNGVQLDLSASNSITSKSYGAGTYHIVVTVTSSSCTLYVNSTTSKGTSSSSAARATKRYLYNNEGKGRFHGAIYSIRIWNKCLNSTEIQTLFTEKKEPWLYQQINGKSYAVTKVLRKVNGGWSQELTSIEDFNLNQIMSWNGNV